MNDFPQTFQKNKARKYSKLDPKENTKTQVPLVKDVHKDLEKLRSERKIQELQTCLERYFIDEGYM